MMRYLYEILFILNIYKNDLKDMLLYNKRRSKWCRLIILVILKILM